MPQDHSPVRETYERLFHEARQQHARYSLEKRLNPAYLALESDPYLTPEYDEVGGFRLSLQGVKLYGRDGNTSGKFAVDEPSLKTLFLHEFGHLVFRSYLSALDPLLRSVYDRLESYGAWGQLAKRRALTAGEQREREQDYAVFRSEEYRKQVEFFTKSLAYHEFFADAFSVLTQDRPSAVFDLFKVMADGNFQISAAHLYQNTLKVSEIRDDECQADNRACLGSLRPLVWDAYLKQQRVTCGVSACSRDQKLKSAYTVLDRLARILYAQIQAEDQRFWVATHSRSRAERLQERMKQVF